MQPSRQHSLAGSRFALNQHRALAVCYFRRGFLHSLDDGTLSEEGIKHDSLSPNHVGSLLLLVSGILEKLTNDHQQRGTVQRLRETLLDAFFDQRYSQFHRTVCGQNNDGKRWLQLLKGPHEFECGPVREAKIKDRHIGGRLAKCLMSAG